MPATGFSGGRLLALTLAEALAVNGAEVDFLVNNIPEMYREFQSFSRVRLQKVDFSSLNLSSWADRTIDVVIIIPHHRGIPEHGEWLRHAIECRAKVVLLSFETPNWFNSVSPYKRDPELWAGWDIVSEYADLILSISGEGDKYARDYYKNVPSYCLFDFGYPAINTSVADQAPDCPDRKKQIVMLTRVDAHKGYNDLEPLIHPDLSGYQLILILGNGKIDGRQLKAWHRQFDKVGMTFKIKKSISTLEKFKLLKESSLLYFPSRFEGFGIPLLEAAYCLLPSASSDLPVLREFAQKAAVYGNPEDSEDMHRAVMEAIESQDQVIAEYERISKIASMKDYGYHIIELLEKIV